MGLQEMAELVYQLGAAEWVKSYSFLFLYHLYMLLIRHSSPFSCSGYDADLGMR